MSIESISHSPDQPDDTPPENSQNEPDRQKDFSDALREAEENPSIRAAMAYAALYGGTNRDVTEIARMYGGINLDYKKFIHVTERAGGIRSYGRALAAGITESNALAAKRAVYPYLVEKRGTSMWRWEPEAAAYAYHFIKSGCSQKAFARAMKRYLGTPASEAAIGSRYYDISKDFEKWHEDLAESLRIVAGDEKVSETEENAKALISSAATELYDIQYRRASFMQEKPVLKRFIQMLKETHNFVKGDIVQIVLELRKEFPNTEIKEKTVYRVVNRYRKDPEGTLKKLEKGFSAEE